MNFKTVKEIHKGWQDRHVRSRSFAVISNQKYSYQDLADTVSKMVGLLQEQGLKPGNRVVLSVANPLDTSILFWSMLASGITVVGIDSEAGKTRAQFIIQQADADGFIIDKQLISSWGLEGDSRFILPVHAAQRKKGKLYKKLLSKKKVSNEAPEMTYPAILEAREPNASLPEIESSTLAYILFTSGTTANPKGVMISHQNLFTHLETLGKQYKVTAKSHLLNILKLYHADGVIQGPILAGYNACTWHRPLEFEIPLIPDLLDSIYRNRITHAVMVPTILYLLHKFGEDYEDSFETEDFQCVVSVSSHIELALWEAFEERFKTRIVNVYGLTETVAGSFFCGPDETSRKVGTIGKAIDCEAQIVTDSGAIAQAHEEGELQLRGDHVFAGYFNNQAASDEAMEGDWLKTGDLAVADEQGFYRITGRKKNIIISGGVNIHPEEITEVINTHPLVLESASLGVKDAAFGEKLVSCVVVEKGAALDATQLTAYLRDRLESSKIPGEIHFMSELPKGLSGKVQLKVLREKLTHQTETLGAMDQGLQAQVIQSAAKAFAIPMDQLNEHANSRNVEGWDSMAHLQFITLLEDKFRMRFSTADIMVMNSIQTAMEMVKKYQ